MQPCPVFSWDRVSIHMKPVGLTQTANQMGCSLPCDVMLSVEVGSWLKEGLFATQEQAEHWVVRTLHVVYAFDQYYSLLFSSPFTILLNCSYPNP